MACSFRRQDLIDNRHPHYVGEIGIAISPELKKNLREADLILAIGPRLGEMTTGGYTLLQIPKPQQRLVHVHPGAEELGRVYQAQLMINAGMEAFAAAAAKLSRLQRRLGRRAPRPCARSTWQLESGVDAGCAQFERGRRVAARAVAADAILTNGAGNFSGWVQRFYQYGGYRTQLAPTNGAMGYGVPAAIAAKIAQPHRTVVCFAGDGDFLMTGQELATAVQYSAAVIVRGREQSMYGTIRMHQEREYPARVFGTDLRNPDFAQLARAYGAHGALVEKTADFAAAFEAAVASGGRRCSSYGSIPNRSRLARA